VGAPLMPLCCAVVLGFARIRSTICYSGARWHCVLRDISEAKRVESSLRDFLATTSHDARTPLNSIQVAAQLLRERALTSEAAELLTAISASARVLHLLIDNVMVTKRLDQGDYDVSPAPVAIRAVVDEACATARAGLAQQAGTPVLWDDAPLPALILSRPQDLSHLLLNVACFCVQTADGTPVRVHASCAPAAAADAAGRTHVLLLRVSSGRALSPDELMNVFDPYADDAGRDWLDKVRFCQQHAPARTVQPAERVRCFRRQGRGSGRLGLRCQHSRVAC
jgi:signal transduction histidine kinase